MLELLKITEYTNFDELYGLLPVIGHNISNGNSQFNQIFFKGFDHSWRARNEVV